ncbi:MAG TPA: pyridoxamine 5'-phosphate oxidase family protein [Pseudomonadales bacterium]
MTDATTQTKGNGFEPTERTRLRRSPARGRYDRDTVYAILDAGLVCHVGYAIDGQPFVTTTAYWRDGDRVYWHGSAASRMLKQQSERVPVCFTVAHLDGLVLARSAFHHSVNYRSVTAYGLSEPIEDEDEKRRQLRLFLERIAPGRSAEVREPNRRELRLTTLMSLPLTEAVAKVRTGPPVDDEADYALPVWAGVLPLARTALSPLPDERLPAGVPVPEAIRRLRVD